MTFKLPEVRWAVLATVLFAIGLASRLAHGPQWLAWTFFLACYAAGGWEPGLAGLRALRAKTLDVDLLMVVAAMWIIVMMARLTEAPPTSAFWLRLALIAGPLVFLIAGVA